MARLGHKAPGGTGWQLGVFPVCVSGLQHIVWSRLSCMATEAFWVPGSHSHWSHIRLIKSDSRPASWLTQFALIRFPFHAEHTHAHIYTHTHRPGCTLKKRARKQKTNREWGSTHWALMKSRKSRYLGNCQHTSSGGPRFPVWLRSYCFGSLLIAAASLDRLSHRWQEFMLNHRELNSSHLRRQEAATLKILSHGFNTSDAIRIPQTLKTQM